MSTPRFTMISTLARLRGAINRATRGHDSGIYEPKPGHAAVYPKYSAQSNGKMVAVDMRGAVAFEAVRS